jgi:hypothetical protein
VEFTLVEGDVDRLELAKLAVPLDWFPPNCVVRESFHMHPLNSSIEVAVLFLEVHRRENNDAKPWMAPYATIVPRSHIAASFTGDSETDEFESAIPIPPLRESFSHEVFSCEPAATNARKADPVFELQTADVFDCHPLPAPQRVDATFGLATVDIFEYEPAPAPEKVARPFNLLTIEIFGSPPGPLNAGDGGSVSAEPEQLQAAEEEEEEGGGQGLD